MFSCLQVKFFTLQVLSQTDGNLQGFLAENTETCDISVSQCPEQMRHDTGFVADVKQSMQLYY